MRLAVRSPACLIVLVGWAAGASAEAPCPPPEPGSNWVVFASFRGGDFASSLHAVRPDGTGECRISRHPTGRPGVLDPAVSSDGSTIVFARGDASGSHMTGVWTMRADGTDERPLARDVIRRFRNGRAAPVLSPDGRRIAFAADGADGRFVRVMNADGSDARDLHRGSFPAWSPDGSRIAFAVPDDDRRTSIWTAAPDGTDVRRLTDGFHAGYPAWTPDGKRIVFSRQVGDTFDLWVMGADGADPRALTATPERSEAYAAWSPDGRWIAFVAQPPDAPDGWQKSIYVMPAAGGDARRITPSEHNDLSPSWLAIPKAATR